MPKYMFEAHYSVEGAKGVMKEGGLGTPRRDRQDGRGRGRQTGEHVFRFLAPLTRSWSLICRTM